MCHGVHMEMSIPGELVGGLPFLTFWVGGGWPPGVDKDCHQSWSLLVAPEPVTSKTGRAQAGRKGCPEETSVVQLLCTPPPLICQLFLVSALGSRWCNKGPEGNKRNLENEILGTMKAEKVCTFHLPPAPGIQL